MMSGEFGNNPGLAITSDYSFVSLALVELSQENGQWDDRQSE
jgi:hypothetical protein